MPQTTCEPVADLFQDLRDGHKLLALLEVLTQQKSVRERGTLRVHCILNVNKVLQTLQEHRITLLNISSEDIVAGNPKLTLSLIWLMALNFDGRRVHLAAAETNSTTNTTLESSLLKWVQQLTQPFGVPVTDFAGSWSDGRAFLCLMADSIGGSFDVEAALQTAPVERLRTAFELARRHLSIDPLLDATDVAKRPDKKSIVLYVMCMYHVIEERRQRHRSGGRTAATGNGTMTVGNGSASAVKTVATVAAATNSSVIVTEMNAYQTSVETVLGLLLEAENLLSGEVSTSADLAAAKAQFERHEQFMIRMSTYQQYVGCALEEGARLLTDTQLSQELSDIDLAEIKQQMSLLNERWETLRMRALSVQTCVHRTLATIQMGKVDELRAILTDIEERVANMGAVSGNPGVLQRQAEEQRALESHLAEQKTFVDRLSNLVVIVNDELFSDFEDKLNALGERWHHLIKWTEHRKERLDGIRGRYRALNGRFREAADWVNARETDLKAMERDEVTEIAEILRRINDVRYCDSDLLVLAEVLADLEQESIGLESTDLLELIEGLNDRCDALREILRVQQMRIGDMGFKFGTEPTRFKRPELWVDYQQRMASGTAESPNGGERSLDDECALAVDYLRNVDARVNRWQSLESSSLRPESLDKITVELSNKLQSLEHVNKQLDDQASANYAIAYKARFAEIRKQFERTSDNLSGLVQASKCSSGEITELKLVLADCRDWFKCNASTATLDELRARYARMDALQEDIQRTRELCAQSNQADPFDWVQFHNSWTDLKENIQCLMRGKQDARFDDVHQQCAALLHDIGGTPVLKSRMSQMYAHLQVFDQFQRPYAELQNAVEMLAADGGDLQAVRVQCTAIQAALNDKIIKQTANIESLKHFNGEIEAAQLALQSLMRSLTDGGDGAYLPGDLPELYATFAQFERYEQQLKKIEIDQISVRNFADILRQGDVDDRLAAEIGERLAGLRTAYDECWDRFRQSSQRLHHVIQRTEQMLLRIDQTELWLGDLELATPRLRNAEIGSLNELFQLKTRFQALKETCEQRTDAFRELNEEGSEMLVQIDEHGSTSQWAKQFTKLNARWTEVTAHVYARTALLEHVYGQLGEFKKLVVSETGYLDRLEKCLRKSPEAAADAEEIYEELDVS